MSLRRATRLASWGVADQALSSLTNFALGVLVARTVGPQEFGAFSLVFATYLLALGVSRALTSEALVVRFSASPEIEWRSATSAATGATIAIGLLGGGVCALVGLGFSEPLRGTLLALGLTLPGLLLQDAWRHAFFAGRRGHLGFANDLVWTIVLFSVIGPLIATGHISVSMFMLAWGGAATVAAVAGALQVSVFPRPRRAVEWWRDQRDLIPRYVGEFAALIGGYQVVLYGAGVVAGLEAAGSIRAAQILLGPLNILLMGAWLVALPELIRLLETSIDRLRSAGMLLSSFLGAAALLWGAMAYLLPTRVGTAVLGSNWGPAHEVILPLSVWMVGVAVTVGASIGLRALQAANRALLARWVSFPLIVAGGVAGAALGDAMGAAAGLAISAWLGVLVWWWQFDRALGDRRTRLSGPSDELSESVLAGEQFVP